MYELFSYVGVHAVVDGQYGSTGKGALSAYLAEQAIQYGVDFGACLSNAGPNSGHTFYHDGEKHVLKQLPTFAVYSALRGRPVDAVLTAGSIIDPDILVAEARKYPNVDVYVHANAAVITDEDKERERSGTIAAVAGTRSGTGAALARKVCRDPGAVVSNSGAMAKLLSADNIRVLKPDEYGVILDAAPNERYFMEVSQGFSLGLNQRFYPHCTSRECTVGQGMADAGLHPKLLAKTYMSVRTYPIRVGNVDGYTSGGYYPDQEEISWGMLGVEPELTTVTHRVRRVFTFSWQQFRDALRHNRPDYVFMNFMNYCGEVGASEMMEQLERMQKHWDFGILYGYGPEVSDIVECG